MRTLRQPAPWWGALTLAILIGATPAASAATLRWKFKPGDSLHYVMEQKTVTTYKRGTAETGKATNLVTVDLTRIVKSVDNDGTAAMTQRFDRARQKMDLGSLKVDYDSTKETDPATAARVASLRVMVGAEFSFKMSARGEVSDVHVPDAVLKAYRESTPRGASGDQFSAEAYKQQVVETSVVFPPDDLSRGKSWSRQLKIPTSDGSRLVQTRTYTYEGIDPQFGPGVEKVGITSKMDFQPDPAATLKPEVKTQECTGTFHFDNEAGRLLSATFNEKIGTTFKDMEATVDQVIDQSSSMTYVQAAEPAK